MHLSRYIVVLNSKTAEALDTPMAIPAGCHHAQQCYAEVSEASKHPQGL